MVYKTLNLVLLCMFIILFIYILNIIKNDFCEKFDPTIPILDTTEITLELNDGYEKMNEYRFKKLDRQDKINKLNTKINNLITKINKSFTNNITPDTNTMIFY